MDRCNSRRFDWLEPPALVDARPSSDIKTKLDADLLTALPTLTANDERPAQGPAVLLTPDVIAVVGIILSGAAIALARWVAF